MKNIIIGVGQRGAQEMNTPLIKPTPMLNFFMGLGIVSWPVGPTYPEINYEGNY